MNRLFVAMDVHKENIVIVGLSEEGPHPVIREQFGGDVSRVVKRFKTLSRTWQVETCYDPLVSDLDIGYRHRRPHGDGDG